MHIPFALSQLGVVLVVFSPSIAEKGYSKVLTNLSSTDPAITALNSLSIHCLLPNRRRSLARTLLVLFLGARCQYLSHTALLSKELRFKSPSPM
ncbi:hypothetical protein B9Z19DRAFT_1090507 [Tuber borchii]|uniref:Uncharacterized protein n=1 Tax=Tuber borchii TaxID=42251 RepID=A0A2T6ZIN9_TUBBO|nr:hypothetical protein B9Z19DRAFT_1090507 [Tuber borchii]